MNTKQLKIIAILSMAYDHITRIFPFENLLLPLAIKLEMQYPQHAETIVTVLLEILPFVLKFIGRLAAPIFMFCITIGYFYTSNLKKYVGRIFLFAILAQVPYILFNQAQDKMYGMELTPFYEVSLNILFTLGTALLALYFFERLRVKNVVLALSPVGLAAVLAHFLHMEGSEAYILIIFMFYILRNVPKPKKIIIWIPILLLAHWRLILFTIEDFSNGSTNSMNLLLNTLLNALGPYLGVFITFFYNGEKGKISKALQYGMYWFYPAHLLLLAVIGFLYY